MISIAERPLANPVFRAIWTATLVSNVGTWMHDVGAGWLMTSLSSDPLMVALVQAATTLPLFLLALPTGALADIMDRRKLLLVAQMFGLGATAILATTTLLGQTTAWSLLGFTTAIGIGAALSAPTFQAIVPELVGRQALQQATVLNGVSVNIARAIGPAASGLIIAVAGTGAVFALNAASIACVVIVLARWRRQPAEQHLPPEHFIGALQAGLRYAWRAPELQRILLRSTGFFLFASAMWALLPIIARRELGLGPAGYGGLLTFMGIGAVAGAFSIARLRDALGTNLLTASASLLLAAAMGALAIADSFPLAALSLGGGGFGWITMMASLNGGAQASSPGWVKARALAIFLLVFQGSMTIGSTLWGIVAGQIGVPLTLLVAASLLMAATLVLAYRFPLPAIDDLDLASSLHWPLPTATEGVGLDRGPVLVTIEYRVAPVRVPAFFTAMESMRRIRRRDGALVWGLYEDTTNPGTILETFTLASWLEHLRQHDRVTNADRVQQDALREFQRDDIAPLVRHFAAR